MKKIVVTMALLTMCALAVPSAAFAYGGSPSSVSSTNPAPGETVTITWPSGTFEDNESPLAATVTCTNGIPVIVTPTSPALFRAGTATSTPFVAAGDGSFTLQVQVPNLDYVRCDCTVVGAETDNTATALLTQVSGALPRSGFDVTPVAWAGGSVLALGLVFVLGYALRRRSTEGK